MKHICKNDDGTYTVILHLKDDEFRRLKRLSKKLNLNDFETIKYAIQLVCWWSKGEIEPEEA
jgi:hypothetical protein